MWNGCTRPGSGEVEVSVFGRGVGEAIAVHLGRNRWLLVDTAQGSTDLPVTLEYLKAIGVRPDAVSLVVASHWDSDHVRGMTGLFAACPKAAFVTAFSIQDPQVLERIAEIGDPAEQGPGRRSVDEITGVFTELARRGHGAMGATCGKLLWEGDEARIWSLSPSDDMELRSLTRLLDNARWDRDPRLDRRNHLSVVLWVEAGPHRILLGGDLEEQPHGGWSAVLRSSGRDGVRAEVFKAPHHGSKNGHMQAVWDDMLAPRPWVALTPFSRSGLPTREDRRRISEQTPHAYLAGAPNTETRDPETERLIHRATASEGLDVLTGPVGHVRFRAPIQAGGRWSKSLYGSTEQL